MKATLTLFLAFLFVAPLALYSGHGNALSPQQLKKYEQRLQTHPEDIRSLGIVANHHYEKGQYKKVKELLSPFANELSTPSKLQLAGAYKELKEYLNEIRILESVVNLKPKNYQSHFILAHAYLSYSQVISDFAQKKIFYDKSVSSFRDCLRINKKYKPAYEALLDLFIERGANYEARSVLQDMIKQFGKRQRYVNDLCRLFTIDGYIPQAEKTCQEAMQISKTFPENHVYLFQTYLNKKEKPLAKKIIINAARKFPKSEFVQWAAGTFYYEEKNYQIAKRYFQKAVTADKKAARSRIGLANATYETGGIKPALSHFIIACKEDPSVVSRIRQCASQLRQKRKRGLARLYTQAASKCEL